MKVGVNLINYGPAADPDSLLRWSRLAEALGYHLLMISDHVAITPDVAAIYPAPFYDPFLILGWLAGLTARIELGTTVIILPYRHPLQVARLTTNLDRLSGGRFILGVGVGWARQEFAALGVPFRHRGELTDEYLEVITAYLRGATVSHEGRFVAFQDVATAPAPVRPGGISIWIGGNGEAARRRAVRFGAAWHPISIRVPWLRSEGLPRLRMLAEQAGAPVPPLCPRIRLRLTEMALNDETRLAGQGSLDQVRADLEALAELGATYVLLDTYHGDPEATRDQEQSWAMLATLAARALDLPGEGLR